MPTVVDEQQRKWKAELISHGQTSSYLNPRVHNPIIQFTCLDRPLPKRYVAFKSASAESLSECSAEELMALFEKSAVH